jgi:hypothetical protein
VLFSPASARRQTQSNTARPEKFQTAPTRHQQQKNRLPDQFHEGIGGDGEKLSHVECAGKFTSPAANCQWLFRRMRGSCLNFQRN